MGEEEDSSQKERQGQGELVDVLRSSSESINDTNVMRVLRSGGKSVELIDIKGARLVGFFFSGQSSQFEGPKSTVSRRMPQI